MVSGPWFITERMKTGSRCGAPQRHFAAKRFCIYNHNNAAATTPRRRRMKRQVRGGTLCEN